MTHKQNVKAYCMQHLEQRGLNQYFSQTEFERIYRTSKGAQCNAVVLALDTADFFIRNSKPIYNDNGNDE